MQTSKWKNSPNFIISYKQTSLFKILILDYPITKVVYKNILYHFYIGTIFNLPKIVRLPWDLES